MRILHVTHSLGYGGIESQLQSLAATASLDSHQFCAIFTGGKAAESIMASGRNVTALNIDPWHHPFRAIRRLAQLIESLRPDIVHCHGLEANIWGVAAARLAGIRKTVAEEIGIWDRSWRATAALSIAYRLAPHIVSTSDAVKRFLIEHRIPARKITTIYNPVRFSHESAKPRVNGEPLRIACVGRLHDVKNPLGLVHAIGLAKIHGLSVEAHFLGDGPQHQHVEELARDLKLGSAVHLHGFQSDPFPTLAKCHLYVQPSPAEGFGIAMVEAMGCGLPVICSRFGAAPEIMEQGAHGWMIDDVQPKTIAAAIAAAAVLKPSRLFEIGQAAQRSVRNRFTPEIYQRELEVFYDNLS